MKSHVAIMKKSWGLIPKILSREKTIESRWYLNKSRPWGNISPKDEVYFKNSGEPVTVKARVKKVLSFENLTPEKTDEIYRSFGKEICLSKNIYRDKKYCILIFLDKPQKIKPFNINKSSFGSMSAWLTVDDIDKIKINEK